LQEIFLLESIEKELLSLKKVREVLKEENVNLT